MTDSLSVIIPDGEYVFALPVLRCLGNQGHRVAVCSSDRWPPIRFSRFLKRFFAIDPLMSESALLESLLDVIKKTNADVLLPVGQQMIPFIVRHKAALDRSIAIAPIPLLATFELAKDKWRLAEFCADRGLSHPPTIHFDGNPQLVDRLAALPFPALLKPVRASYGRGIEYFETAADLLGAVRSRPPQRECIVQSFVPGYDIDCNALCQEGAVTAFTIQRGIAPGYGRFKPPSGIDFVDNEAVRVEAHRLLAALKWTGVAHIDMRYDPFEGRAWIIELNPRYWASILGSLVAGVNFPHLACITAVGSGVPPSTAHSARYVAGRAALRALSGGLGEEARVRFQETHLAFIAADPVPEIFAGLTRPFIGSWRARSNRRRIRNRAWKIRNATVQTGPIG